MKLGLHLSNFTYGVPAAELAAKLTEIVVGGEAAGFDRLSVMDHYFQIPHVGPVDSEMFEAYSILGSHQICEQMWSDDNGPFTGKHYQLKETLCSPRPLQRPRPRILVGGSGEKKTLRRRPGQYQEAARDPRRAL
jgi:alkanesulfonate monooxygenase SsuD/methylene tetrahydromethanopterin reductase-like flavin-dependent oxidoreductase (luciferase family)